MQKLIRDMMQRMLQQIEIKVPDRGIFEIVEEGFDNPDPQFGVRRIWLEVAQPPEGVDRRAWKRFLKIVADNKEGAAVEILLEDGTKQAIIETLQSDKLEKQILSSIKKMDYHLRGL